MTLAPREIIEAPAREWQRYPECKDTGIEWLGDVPAHWETKSLRHVATVQLSNVDKHSIDGELPIRLCNYTDVYYQDFITPRLDFMEASALPREIDKFELQAGDVLITKDSESWDDIAVPAYVTEDLPGVLCGYHLAHIRPSCTMLGQYLFRTFQSEPVSHQFKVEANGITRYGLSGAAIRTGLFPVPSLPEQRAIAAFLDRETQKIDDLISKRERLIELLEEKRTALISRAVTKGLDPDTPMKDSGVEWLGEIPEHWTLMALRRLLTGIEQGWSPVAEDREASREEWGVIKLSAISRGVFRPGEIKALPQDVMPDIRYEIRAGDLLLTRGNTPDLVGDVCVVPDIRSRLMLSDLVYRLSVVYQKADRAYLAHWLLSRAGRYQIIRDARGSSQSMVKVSQEHIRSWSIALPPLGEQQVIVEYLDREMEKIDVLAGKLREHIEKLREYRTALISAAVTGRIDVREEASAPADREPDKMTG